uniref:Uncharacterized protein n=1 Tax=Oryza sativa subsp. japonica TaxID=39947 RepID=Q6K5M6_ORYSJ|nr:hypothetical protein [Oryza sativa Japonica Group]
MRAPHGIDWGGRSAVDRVHGPGKERRTTRCTRGGHVAAARAAGLDSPDLPEGRSDGGGSAWPARTGGSSRPSSHGTRRCGSTQQQRKAATSGDRPAAEGGG